MKKKIMMMIMIGTLLIGGNLYAAGDLIVNGQLGVGASTPSAKVDIDLTTSGGTTNAFKTNLNKTGVDFSNASLFAATDSSVDSQGFSGMTINPWHTGSGNSAGKGFVAANYVFQLRGSATAVASARAQQNNIWVRGSGNYTIDSVAGTQVSLSVGAGPGTGSTHTLTDFSSFESAPIHRADTVNGTKWVHFRATDFTDFSGNGTVTDVAGVWIDNQTFGTNRYGIVLEGDGDGSDIVFGSGKCCRIYSEAGALRAQDGAGNITVFSPHDPVTGEWIFYSQNIKTGRTVRVNMEKLVKAVEKLTGETFMVETLIEDK